MQVKFKCQTDCGKCCVSHEDYAFTFLTPEDIERIGLILRIPVEEFAEKGTFSMIRGKKGTFERWYLKMKGPRCQFLKGTACGIYDIRPTQCRTFPFWPENMDPEEWEKLSEFCPGVGSGDVVELSEINKILLEQAKADVEMELG